jgi:hypothetical protein
MSRSPNTRSAEIRRLLGNGFAPLAIARIIDCPVNAVHVVKHHMLKGRKSRKRETEKPRSATAADAEATKPVDLSTPPITVGFVDKLAQRLKTALPDGYQDIPNAKPVDWSLALAWMRRNPPPHLRGANP